MNSDSNSLVAGLVEAFDFGIVVADERGLVAVANARFSACFGAHGGVVGRPFGDVLAAFGDRFAEPAPVRAWFERARHAAEVSSERDQRLVDGRRVTLEVRPFALGNGATGAALLVRDTHERGVEEEAERAKETFTAMVSHELRTPVAGIVGMTELLLQSRLAPEDRDAVSTIARSAQGLLELLNDLLDYAKIRAGKFEIQAAPCRLDRELRSACGALDTIAKSRGLQLVVNVDEALRVEASVDASRVRQVLTNLLGNALKFTPSGCVRVEATVTGADSLRVEVEDSGVGVPADKTSRLFEAFFQGEGTTARQFKGTGLGLAISREIVHGLGGEIGYFPNPIVGSTFWFEVPFVPLASVPSAPPPSPPVVEPRPTDAGRVLLAEDDPVNRRVLLVMLGKLGYEAVAVEDGQAAIDAAGEQPFSVIIMDCMMPGVDGYTAARAIRAGGGPNARTAIVALTANAMRGDRERCLAAGMDDHVAKPVAFTQLEALLVRWRRPLSEPPVDDGSLDFLPPELREELCEIYARETVRRVTVARSAIADGDAVALAKVAHDLAGSSGALHVSSVSELAYQLEHGARQGAALGTLSPLVDDLERRFQRWRSIFAP